MFQWKRIVSLAMMLSTVIGTSAMLVGTPALPPPLLVGSPAAATAPLPGTSSEARGLEMEAWVPFKELESVLTQDPVSLQWFGAEVQFTPEQLAGLRRMVTATREFRPRSR